jgi:hypothetical protein
MIRVVHYLCPLRHVLVSLAYSHDLPPQYAETALVETLRANACDLVCPVCGTEALAFEHGQTAFATLREAEPALLAQQAAAACERFTRYQALADRARRN